MTDFPFSGVADDYVVADESLETAREAAIDFDTGEIIFNQNGDIVIVEGLEAIKVWCYLAILTERFKHQIFTDDYGSEHRTLIGYEYTKELTESEAYRFIEECIIANPYVTSVKNKGVNKKGDRLYVNIELETVYGSDSIRGWKI